MEAQIRILHVDGDADFAGTTAALLERADDGLEVVTETDAIEALARIDDGGIDCVVSDYRVRGMDGLELLEAVREDYPDLPFVLFTPRGSEEVAIVARTADAHGWDVAISESEAGGARFEIGGVELARDRDRRSG